MQGKRRVVTGHDASGKSIFVSDEDVEQITFSSSPEGGFHLMWATDEVPTFPSDGIDPYDKGLARHFYPTGPGSFRVHITSFAPQRGGTILAELDPAEVLAETEAKVPGIMSALEPDHPGMHTTDSVDIILVLAGEVTLELDDGAEKVCRAGDIIVQNGTRHRWHNNTDELAVTYAVLIGGHPRG